MKRYIGYYTFCGIIALFGATLLPTFAQDSSRSTPLGTTTPGDYPFTSEQDRAFYQALKTLLPAQTRFQFDTQYLSADWLAAQESPMSITGTIRKNMAIAPEFFQPDVFATLRRKADVARAFAIPGIRENAPVLGLYEEGNLEPLERALGLIEDDTPTMHYSLQEPSFVKAVMYSVQTIAVAHILSAFRYPGSYTITWNGRNDAGQRVNKGSYVGEITIGKRTVVRKGIRN